MNRFVFVVGLLAASLGPALADSQTPTQAEIEAMQRYTPHAALAKHGARLQDGRHISGEEALELVETGDYVFQIEWNDDPDAAPDIKLVGMDDDMRAFLDQGESSHPGEPHDHPHGVHDAVGKPWPFPRFTSLDGKAFDLEASDAPQVTIVDYWFTLCSPCIQAMPKLNEIQARYADQPVAFIAPTFEGDEAVERFLKRREFNFDVVTNAESWFQEVIGQIRAPVYLWINDDNIVEAVLEGPDEIEQRLAEHFGS